MSWKVVTRVRCLFYSFQYPLVPTDFLNKLVDTRIRDRAATSTPSLLLSAEIWTLSSTLPRLAKHTAGVFGAAGSRGRDSIAASGLQADGKGVSTLEVLQGWKAAVEALEQSERYSTLRYSVAQKCVLSSIACHDDRESAA